MSKKFTPTPHDTLFKQFLSEKETAKEFFEIWLPDEIKSVCNLETIRAESSSFIDEEMKNYQSDILYSVNTKKGKGYLYLLIEHQSTPDKLIAWRLMRYSMAAMQKHLEAGHKKLPLVYPILFYAGEKSPHPHSTYWLDCFNDSELAEKIYTKPFKQVDVTTLDDGEIMKHRRIALLELVQKHIRQRDMSELLHEIAKLLSYDYYTEKQAVTMMNYLIQEGNAKNPIEFVTDIAKTSVKHKEALMTIAQQIEKIGVQKGEKQATLKLAKQFLVNGVDRNTVKLSTGLSEKELDKLERKN
ncbi:Rpn family recombination-promoting nuclease/putative transposase [Arsenophonus nasoniae]|uniref:Rpn family recombination-promoting nuclease/putative transposase n=1 Tax=Arsenophonus nasoniae TaxID=638 RepID=A0AA95GGP9_9GAMM|nr:Rpn family recombination-promoting nuclease/putative transposase [Arsenophonus nasoniae]WGL93763.1 Rpn family recombination-promoting nuclease/putative transposase [Arsenophonus nasoniae]WGL96025.1 Rpn family recombination-promoting nuclease/putative transposase [Arsenophonus nasoniae]